MRTRLRAFHPRGEMRVLTPSTRVFAVLRISPEGDRRVLALTNVTAEVVRLECLFEELGVPDKEWYDLIAGEHWNGPESCLKVELGPYDVMWLVPERERLADRGESSKKA
jgi:sucrose phosphorylase